MTIESIICTCSQMPNQFQGVVDGKPFYFRARHGEWYLAVNESGRNEGDGLHGRVVAEGCGAGEPDGWTEPADAEAFVRKQLDLYSAGKCPHCEGTGRSTPPEGAAE